MGDRVAVMRSGLLQQCDRPQTLYDDPDNLFVATFIGSPSMNLYEGELAGDEREEADARGPADEADQGEIVAASVSEGVARVDPRSGISRGRTVFGIDVERLHFFDPATGNAVGAARAGRGRDAIGAGIAVRQDDGQAG